MSEALKALLERAELADRYQVFVDEDIDENIAASLSDNDLRDLGLTIGQRKRFRAAVAEAVARAGAGKGDGGAERRQITVVFADLVGFTTIATRFDPEDLREVVSTYLRAGIAAMQSYGGHLAHTQGDGIMVYFGYPVAHEDDAERAIRASLAAVEAIEQLRTKVEDGLKVRIGLATGRVVIGDMVNSSVTPQEFAVGETPNLAARLQSLAGPGEIMVSSETKALVGGYFDFQPRGAVELKGFAEPRPVYRVLGERATRSRFDARASDGLLPLIGRRAELGRLEALWAEAAGGKGRVGLVQGPPGMGKSRLTRALVAAAGGEPIEWQCAPHLANRALHPMLQEIERAAGIERTAPQEDRLARLTAFVAAANGLEPDDIPVLADLLRIEGAQGGEMDAQTRARRVADILIRRVAGHARDRGPTLVVLEDAHWADPATQEFLDQFVTALADLPAHLVVTYRPEYEPPEAFRALGDEIELAPLEENAVVELVDLIGGGRRLPVLLIRQIIAKTDGVPLFVEEMTKAILDAVPDGGRGISAEALETISIPSTLQDSLMARLDQMRRAKEIAQLGAVIGREFTREMVAAIAPAGASVDAALEELMEAELLHRDGVRGPDFYVFNHALVQDAAYESILKSRRQTTHLNLARAMLDGHAAFGETEPEIIARHCDLGGLAEEAVEHWLRAGQDAVASAANLAAVRYLQAALRALETLPDSPERERRELGVQMALMPASMAIYGWGAPEVERAALRARDLARALGDGEALFGASWGVWTLHFLRAEMGKAMEVAREVDAMAHAVGAPFLLTPADHAVGYSHFYRGEFREALARYEIGLPRYDPEVEEQIILTFQLSSMLDIMEYGAAAFWVLGREEEAARALDDALAFADRINHPPSLAYGLGAAGQTLAMQRDWARLEEIALRCKKLSAEEGFILWERVADQQLAVVRGMHHGDVKGAADEALQASANFLATGTRLTDVLYYPATAEILIAVGRAGDAVTLLDKGIAHAHKHLEQANLAELHRARGMAWRAMGEAKRAQEEFLKALQIAKKQGAKPFEAWAAAQLERHVA